MDIEKSLESLTQRVAYARDIMGARVSERLEAVSQDIISLGQRADSLSIEESIDKTQELSRRLTALEDDLDGLLTPMDKVRIVRHPQRVCLKDILENVYEDYTELGGEGEANIDPAMVVAKANILRRVKNRFFPPFAEPLVKADLKLITTAAESFLNVGINFFGRFVVPVNRVGMPERFIWDAKL